MFNKITKIKFEYEDLKAITFLFFIVVIATVVSCNQKQEPLKGTENWVGERVEVTTYFYVNQQRLDMAYKKLVDPDDKLSKKGFAIWHQGIPECEIHMKRIEYKNDKDAIQTLGHEMLHCLKGTWHAEITF
tara:strand:+ start:78187 stop:78579 length:393 start_codon:yes stop_codon:yes gene_type:complete